MRKSRVAGPCKLDHLLENERGGKGVLLGVVPDAARAGVDPRRRVVGQCGHHRQRDGRAGHGSTRAETMSYLEDVLARGGDPYSTRATSKRRAVAPTRVVAVLGRARLSQLVTVTSLARWSRYVVVDVSVDQGDDETCLVPPARQADSKCTAWAYACPTCGAGPDEHLALPTRQSLA